MSSLDKDYTDFTEKLVFWGKESHWSPSAALRIQRRKYDTIDQNPEFRIGSAKDDRVAAVCVRWRYENEYIVCETFRKRERPKNYVSARGDKASVFITERDGPKKWRDGEKARRVIDAPERQRMPSHRTANGRNPHRKRRHLPFFTGSGDTIPATSLAVYQEILNTFQVYHMTLILCLRINTLHKNQIRTQCACKIL